MLEHFKTHIIYYFVCVFSIRCVVILYKNTQLTINYNQFKLTTQKQYRNHVAKSILQRFASPVTIKLTYQKQIQITMFKIIHACTQPCMLTFPKNKKTKKTKLIIKVVVSQC